MKYWMGFNTNGETTGIKAIIGDNLLNCEGAYVSDLQGSNSTNFAYNCYDTGHVCFLDTNGEQKNFKVIVNINDTYISAIVDDLSFITGGDNQHFDNNCVAVIEGTIKNPNYKDTEDILFIKEIKGAIYIDILTVSNDIVVNIDDIK